MPTRTRDNSDRVLMQVWVEAPTAAAVDEAAERHNMTRPQFLRTVYGLVPQIQLKLEVNDSNEPQPA